MMKLLTAMMTASGLAILVALAGCGDGEKQAAEAADPYPVGRPVPDKEGFVFSPFNNKVIDVRGIPPGTLAADPTYPASEKKYFRVPEAKDQQ